MARNHKPEEIIGKLREAEIVLARGDPEGGGPDRGYDRPGAPSLPATTIPHETSSQGSVSSSLSPPGSVESRTWR